GELELLAKDLLINVTSFFRDSSAFEFLAKEVIPDLVHRHSLDRPLRIWVAGCSTGEETYSLAILLLEAIAAGKRNIKLQVFASDVDEDAVALAREGRYSESIALDVLPERLARFFTQEDHSYRVVPELRGAVVFTAQDVLADQPFSHLDLISCRNLLIYLRPEAQEKVLLLFHFALRDGGVLMLGSSETVGSLDDRFEPISKKQRIYRQIGHSRLGEVDFPIGPGGGGRTLWPGRARPAAAQGISARDLTQRLLLETYAPASVLINRKHECLYYSGPTDRYLQVAAGEPSRDLLNMAREGLRNKLRAAIQHASRENALTIATGAQVSYGGNAVVVRIEVHPVQSAGEDLLLVSFFDEPKHEPTAGRPAEPADDPSRIAELERELDASRKELQSAIHDLEIANEEEKAINQEAMSANEEFQSTNEELMTSREELQSLNEELTALNSQLQETLERQRSTSNDLQNILDSSGVATMFLDSELNIRFFTPAAKSLFRVIATDIGRPLADLARRINDTGLLADAGTVLAGHVPPNREVEADDGAWYTRRILPYRTQDAQVAGVVITFADISERKTAERAIEAARFYSDSIINTIRQPLVVLDEELYVISASRAFYSIFLVEPEQTVGRQLDAIDEGRLDIAALRVFLDRLRNGEGVVEDHEIDVELPPRGMRSLLVSALDIRDEPPTMRKILLTIEDITERKHAAEALEAAKRQAEHANLGKSRFLAAASHDLRQPLQTISLLHELLAKKVRDETTLKLVGRLDETVSTMSSMLDTLLDINQLEAGIVRGEMIDFPINTVLEHLRTQFVFHAAAHGLGWRVVPSSLSVRSDPRLLEQMIRNLLSNAVKYTNAGKILLGCRRRGEKLRIEVWDTGSGIPEEELHAIFEEFHQLDNPARERSKGLGLGLAIVERLADLLGHAVDVRSRPGKGSVFTVEVPLLGRDAPTWQPRHVAPEATESTHRNGEILVVEDDPSVREMLALLLENEGHRTIAAEDGRKALELAARRAIRPDLVVSDYNLPKGLNGLQVVAGLRETLDHEIPAIILTGDISTDTLREIAQGGHLHLNKPVKAKELMDLIRRCLAQPPPAAKASTRQPFPAGGPRLPTVFVVDDDRAVRETMRDLLQQDGRTVELYASSEAFLEAYHPGREGCLLVDARMPGMGGLQLLQRLKSEGSRLPAIMITGQGDVRMAVEAMQAGAADFIEKPVGRGELLASIEHALEHTGDSAKLSALREAAAARFAGLTARQRQIMKLVLGGHPSKNIAADLGISQRTVENHRAAVMKKSGSHSLSALIRLVLAAEPGAAAQSLG
ncbi:MAG: CheR family methyltransferase, partial [Stellaceae bacterium]